jgi:hypothetical protein
MRQADRMRILREWIHRLWGTVLPGRRDDDLEQELRLHMEMAAEDAGRRGLSCADSSRAARLKVGGVAQAMDALRDQQRLPWLDSFRQDLQYAFRSLGRTPGFAAAAILSLALGIGANTAIFNLLETVLLRSLPVNRPDRLVVLANRNAGAEADHRFSYLSSPSGGASGSTDGTPQ